EMAAHDFVATEHPISYRELAKNIAANVDKPIALEGEVVETQRQGYQTMLVLNVSSTYGCDRTGTCTVRLVQGSENTARQSDTLRGCGRVSRAFSVQGRPEVPEVEVDFALRRRP